MNTHLLEEFQITIGWRFSVFVQDELSVTLGCDGTTARIFYAMYRAVDLCLQGAMLETEIGTFVHCAVFHNEVCGIAEGLCARNLAVDKAQIL